MNQHKKNKAGECLLLHWDGKLPVNPVSIANALGITVYKQFLDQDSVHIIKDSNLIGYSITVNSHDSRVRQRFSIAHAMGHILLQHLHSQSTPYVDTPLSFSSKSIGQEKEANQFALELLLPERLTRTWFNKMIRTDISEAAKMFDVSEAALYQRLLSLNLIKE